MTSNPRIPRGQRSAALVASGLIAVVTLSGCIGLGRNAETPAGNSESSGDARTAAQVTEELGALPGVDTAFVSAGPEGLPNQINLAVGLNLESGYSGDVAVLVDYVLAMAWSMTAKEPTTGASVGFLDGAEELDLAPVAAELGWSGMPGPKLEVSVDDLVDRYGPWPGPVPERPAELG